MLVAMVTIHDLTDDDDRLLELCWTLDSKGQSDLLRQAAVAVCYARAKVEAARHEQELVLSPDAVTTAELSACMPSLPGGWPVDCDDFHFEVKNLVVSRLSGRETEFVLAVSDQDKAHAELLAGWALEHARRIARNYFTPEFEVGEDVYVSVDSMKQFIEDWRDAFMLRLTKPPAPRNR